jgi:competence protein ComEC
MDKDHGYGILELMAYMPVKKVFISDYSFEKSDFYYSFLNIANEKKIPVFLLKAGDKVRLTEDMEMSCLYPIKEAQLSEDDNHGSMVLRLDMEEVSVLFMGDAGHEDEEVMLENKALLDCTILKVGHHGSKYSTSAEFLKKTSPEIAIISCGKNNVYGHPHEETLQRLEDEKVDYIQTKESGTISIKTNGKKYWVKTMTGRP